MFAYCLQSNDRIYNHYYTSSDDSIFVIFEKISHILFFHIVAKLTIYFKYKNI